MKYQQILFLYKQSTRNRLLTFNIIINIILFFYFVQQIITIHVLIAFTFCYLIGTVIFAKYNERKYSKKYPHFKFLIKNHSQLACIFINFLEKLKENKIIINKTDIKKFQKKYKIEYKIIHASHSFNSVTIPLFSLALSFVFEIIKKEFEFTFLMFFISILIAIILFIHFFLDTNFFLKNRFVLFMEWYKDTLNDKQ